MAGLCPRCHRELVSGAILCPYCGARLERQSPSPGGQAQVGMGATDAFLKRRLIGLSTNFLGMLVLIGLLLVLLFLMPPLRCPLGLALLLCTLIASMNYARLRSSLRQFPGGLRRLFF